MKNQYFADRRDLVKYDLVLGRWAEAVTIAGLLAVNRLGENASIGVPQPASVQPARVVLRTESSTSLRSG
jgi:hypothetical protein